jgi:hypothetical protein
MRVGVVLLQLQLALVVEQPIEHERRVPVGAFDGRAVEGRVVVRDEGIELQGEVAEAGAVGLLQDLPGHGEPLPVAGRRPAFAPVERGIQAGDRLHQRRQGGALRLLGHLPVADPLELLVSDALGDLGHRVQADVAAVCEHDGQKQAHVLGVTSSALNGGQKVGLGALRRYQKSKIRTCPLTGPGTSAACDGQMRYGGIRNRLLRVAIINYSIPEPVLDRVIFRIHWHSRHRQ